MAFNWVVYKELNPDLTKAGLATQQDLEKHYILHGKNEKRNTSVYQVYPEFNPDVYRSIYSDLKTKTNYELEIHWLVHGRKEGRTYVNTTFKFVIMVPSISIGGGNYWAHVLKKRLESMNITTTIAALRVNDTFYAGKDIVCIDNNFVNYLVLNNITHVISTIPYDMSLIPKYIKKYILTHSDVSYVNNFIIENHTKVTNVLVINNITREKFLKNSINSVILNNYLDISNSVNTKTAFNDSINMLYCNRISSDKNVLMIIFAINNLVKQYPNIRFKLLAGGYKDDDEIYKLIQKFIEILKLNNNITILEETQNTHPYYLDTNFCILASVSEGCSYNILESINYEVPILTTNNKPNRELLQNTQPMIYYKYLEEYNDILVTINNYDGFLIKLGYVFKYELCNSCSIQTTNILVPIMCNINLCSTCKNLINTRKDVFNNNVISMANGIKEMIDHYSYYKSSIVTLKTNIKTKYFDSTNYSQIIKNVFNV